VNSYAQLVVQNKNSGASSSADIIVNNDRSAGTTYYGDFGINGTTFSGGGVFGDVDGTYLYAAGGTLSLGSLNAFDVKIATNNTERVRVSAAGSVGIGTTNPTKTLQVQGDVRITGAVYDSTNSPGTSGQVLQSTVTGTQWTTAASGGGGISSVSISTNTTNQAQYLTYVTGTGSTTGFGVTTTGLVFNPSTGNLGIGTTNPVGQLQVSSGPVIIGSATSTGTLSQRLQVTGGAYISTSTGIGTTNPLQALHVVDAIVVSSASTSLNNAIQTKTYSNQFSIEDIDGYGIKQYISIDKSDTDLFKVNDDFFNTRFVVGAGGSIGIGTTLPKVQLHLSSGPVVIGAANSTGTVSQTLQVIGGAYISTSTGIGTTNPSQLLHVQGNVRIVGGIYDNNNVVGAAGSVLVSTGVGVSWGTAAPSLSISTSVTSQFQYLSFVSGVSTSIVGVSTISRPLVFIPSTGSLGIGTTNPVGQLQVSSGPVIIGTATSTGTSSQPLQVTGGAYVSGNLGVGITAPSFKADIAGDARVTSTNKMRFGGTAGTTNFYIQYNSTTNSLDFVAG
jgi:hypothetical protein